MAEENTTDAPLSAEKTPEAENPWAALGFRPGMILRSFGMRRSGNHAIINWLTRNPPAEGVVFLNNCGARRSPFTSCSSIEVNGEYRKLKRRATLPSITGDVADGGLLVISYEDVMPSARDSERALSAEMPKGAEISDLIFFRHFMNWAASMLRKLQANKDYGFATRMRIMSVAVEKYRDSLELVLKAAERDIVPVCYDTWLKSDPYRSGVLKALGLPQKDNTLGKVQPYGGGSSFQKRAKTSEDLNTLDRWTQMISLPDYQMLLLLASQDQPLMELMQKTMPQDASMVQDFVAQARFPFDVKVGGNT
jgi:hypothetical protein